MGGFLCYVAGSFTPSICFCFWKFHFRSLVLVKLLPPENVKILLPKSGHTGSCFFFKAEKKANYAAPPFSIMEEIQNVGLLLCLVSFKTSLVNLSLFCWHHKSLVQSKHTKQEQNDLSNRGCVFGGICCFSSVLLITTDTECETMCCQTLGSINIIPAHWAGIQPISGPKPGEFFLQDIHFKRTTQSKDSSGDCFYLATNMLSNY